MPPPLTGLSIPAVSNILNELRQEGRIAHSHEKLSQRGLNSGSYLLLTDMNITPTQICVINVDYGTGSSFVIDGQIWRGSLYGSGEIGHTIVNPDGVICDCGRYGCLETVASLSALKKQARIWLKSQPASDGLDPE